MLGLTGSKRWRLGALTAITALSADCGGPVSTRLNSPAEPAVPVLSRNSSSDSCAQLASSGKVLTNQAELQLAGKTKIGYKEKIKAYLDDKCVSCHKPGGQKPDLSSFAAAKKAAKASLATIDGDAMPPDAPATSSEKQLFAAWVTAGMPQTASGSADATSCDASKKPSSTPSKTKPKPKDDSDGGTPDTVPSPAPGPGPGPSPSPGPAPAPSPAPGGSTVTYKAVIKPYLDNRCGSCHGRAPVLTSYSTAKSGAVESLNSMKAGRMPPGSRPAQTDIDNLQAWISAGYPE